MRRCLREVQTSELLRSRTLWDRQAAGQLPSTTLPSRRASRNNRLPQNHKRQESSCASAAKSWSRPTPHLAVRGCPTAARTNEPPRQSEKRPQCPDPPSTKAGRQEAVSNTRRPRGSTPKQKVRKKEDAACISLRLCCPESSDQCMKQAKIP